MAKTIAAGVFLVRKNGTLLVCHPTNHKPDFWSIPKGKVDVGESLLDGAIRETFEETNIDLRSCFNLRSLPSVNYNSKKKELNPFVIFESESGSLDWNSFKIKCNSFVAPDRGGFPEMDDFKWVTLEDAKALLHETQVACIDAIETLYKQHG